MKQLPIILYTIGATLFLIGSLITLIRNWGM